MYYYPNAILKLDGQSGGSWTDGPYKVVLHTTETRTVPGYQNGRTAPHLTYFPAADLFYQHTPFDRAARAMVNGPNPVQTNRDKALQLEIVCYSAKSIADRVGGLWVGHLSDLHLERIAGFLDWTHNWFGVAMRWPGRQAYSYSEANAPGFRMSFDEWDNFDGVCGHQHVPDGNTHWDPGALYWWSLMDKTAGGIDVRIGPGGIMAGNAVRRTQTGLWRFTRPKFPNRGDYVKMVLQDESITYQEWADGLWGPKTSTVVTWFQNRRGYPTPGYVDPLTYADILDQL